MHIPTSTYRVQLHKDFTLSDLENIIDYLHDLGVTTIYAAPIVTAVPGSMHGYDVTDPHVINPEIGTLEQLMRISARLKEKNMSWLQDIVPNHMAFHPLNWRLMDVMERHSASPYHRYFDIDWHHPSAHLNGKLQVPFLGKELESCIADGEIKVSFSDAGFTVDYFQTRYPLSLSAYPVLFAAHSQKVKGWQEFLKKAEALRDRELWHRHKMDFVKAISNDEAAHFAVLELLETVNSDPQKLQRLLESQHYTLTFWKHTENMIGYRRFFTVNELICLRMEDDAVFEEYHKVLGQLYEKEIVQGFRIDHIDGLKDPSGYIRRLRKRFGEDCYIIAEKILEAKENMPAHWPLEGTSGYEFLSHVSQLITNRKGAKQLATFYRELVPSLPAYHELVLANKRLILEQYMAGEWENLVRFFMVAGLFDNCQFERIRAALGLLMVSLPVYRIYPEQLPLKGNDVVVMNEAFHKALANGKTYRAELEYLQRIFTQPLDDAALSDRALDFLKRLMQFTGPLTAKGVEDTTFYVYNALISHDEVGDAPSTLGISVTNFHAKMAERQRATPFSLNATATHDTKRGEDARLRLNVLCEFPDQWQQLVLQWLDMNRPFHHRTTKGNLTPSKNDEYYIYQAIIGGFPEDLEVTQEWLERLQAYQVKVVREAKVYSDWGEPDEEYEAACGAFIRNILSPGSAFLTSLIPFMKKVNRRANRLALVQALVRITAPGIPDTYQGCELWDLSFVDPDNRRPVDYTRRKQYLDALISKEQEGSDALFGFLKDHSAEGLEKFFVIWKSLNFRKHHPIVFENGTYIPLQATAKETTMIAYARHHEGRWVVVAAPLGAEEPAYGDDDLILPEHAPSSWRNVFTGETMQAEGRLRLSECFRHFPVALFTS
ncbi:malto-oligosyltrehalose synthase [Fulvivirgaceae bacterium PWU4]|uniref:Malto-oligosyltrehalose synthase n=1 Tax=Chryseosolibacter histidini TaxID=2782349 RepID=A0AAP2DRZ0_9BACT|nr:malto-oligosyltrehalose synthase [Chryseosolibacter histidini]MBT1701426.1 malto-oligosyltrehalose synthase [Chryseosolibacter histidini]